MSLNKPQSGTISVGLIEIGGGEFEFDVTTATLSLPAEATVWTVATVQTIPQCSPEECYPNAMSTHFGIFVAVWCSLVVGGADSLNDGLLKTPPMGWLSWEMFGCQTKCNAKDELASCIRFALPQHCALPGAHQ